MQSVIFAKKLARAWSTESNKSNFSEVQQFRALMRSFATLRGPFNIEEFHGMKHQVVFNGKGSWGRPSARCEISDLLIVSYKKNPEFQARVTLLQAKKSNEKHASLCDGLAHSVPYTDFKATVSTSVLSSGLRSKKLPNAPGTASCMLFVVRVQISLNAIKSSSSTLHLYITRITIPPPQTSHSLPCPVQWFTKQELRCQHRIDGMIDIPAV